MKYTEQLQTLPIGRLSTITLTGLHGSLKVKVNRTGPDAFTLPPMTGQRTAAQMIRVFAAMVSNHDAENEPPPKRRKWSAKQHLAKRRKSNLRKLARAMETLKQFVPKAHAMTLAAIHEIAESEIESRFETELRLNCRADSHKRARK